MRIKQTNNSPLAIWLKVSLDAVFSVTYWLTILNKDTEIIKANKSKFFVINKNKHDIVRNMCTSNTAEFLHICKSGYSMKTLQKRIISNQNSKNKQK